MAKVGGLVSSYQHSDKYVKQIAVDIYKQNPDNTVMDWKTLIAKLQDAGLSQTDIGRRLNKSQAWVSAVSLGKYDDLKWSDGESLLKLHAEKLGADDTPQSQSLSGTPQRLHDTPPTTHQEAA